MRPAYIKENDAGVSVCENRYVSRFLVLCSEMAFRPDFRFRSLHCSLDLVTDHFVGTPSGCSIWWQRVQCSVKGAFGPHSLLRQVETADNLLSVLCYQAKTKKEVLVSGFGDIYTAFGRLLIGP